MSPEWQGLNYEYPDETLQTAERALARVQDRLHELTKSLERLQLGGTGYRHIWEQLVNGVEHVRRARINVTRALNILEELER